MPKQRGQSHTTLTETAKLVVKIIRPIPGIKMIAPGEISPTRAKSKRITLTYTTSGVHLLISGQGIQKVSVHTTKPSVSCDILYTLKKSKALQDYIIAERVRKPDIA